MGKQLKEIVILDTGMYDLEYTSDLNIQSFHDVNKVLQYWNGELFTYLKKTLEEMRKDLWRAIVGKENEYDAMNVLGLQTTSAFNEALEKY